MSSLLCFATNKNLPNFLPDYYLLYPLNWQIHYFQHPFLVSHGNFCLNFREFAFESFGLYLPKKCLECRLNPMFSSAPPLQSHRLNSQLSLHFEFALTP